MSAGSPSLFNPGRALRVLTDHGVRFVIIGGMAATVRGSPLLTFDLDICYARDAENLTALAAALKELGAELRGVDEPVPFNLDARALRNGDAFTFSTDAGALDVLGTPSGSDGFDDLFAGASRVELEGVPVSVASVEALLRMKRAAGRAKDLAAVPYLEALQDEIENPPRHRR